MKTLYFDVETTGLDPKLHEIIQLAYIIEVDGQVKIERSLYMRPLKEDSIDQEALDIQRVTHEDVMKRGHPFIAYGEFLKDLGAYCDKYDPKDKYFPCAYNGRFDLDFLSAFFINLQDKYLGSWINWKLLDPMSICHWLNANNRINLENYKLSTVASYFGVTVDHVHDAISDVKALRDIYNNLKKFITSPK